MSEDDGHKRVLAAIDAAETPPDMTGSGTHGPAGGDDAEAGEAAPKREPRAMGYSVERMNEEWAVILLGSKALVMHERADAPLEDRVRFLSVDAFKVWFKNRRTEYKKGDDIASTTWADRWLASKDRRQYRGIEFRPGEEGEREDYFNLWRGFSVEPKRGGSYTIFRDHLFTNVCHGDKALFAWVFGWFAHIFQRPQERIGTSLVLRGAMGSGKTKVGEVFGSLIQAHYFMVDDPRYVTGQFNAHMSSCLLLQAEEAVWAGDKAAEGRLKGLVTSQYQMIEHKGVDSIRLQNFVRLIMTSNEDWVVPAGKDERRFCVLDVSSAVAQNHAYFREMEEELAAGGREALLQDLLDYKLDDLNLREIPKTAALLEQKIRSLDPVEAWWLSRLKDGSPTHELDHWPISISRRELINDFINASEKAGVKRRGFEVEIGMKLRKIAPGIRSKRIALDEKGKRVWCYMLPGLDEAREAFGVAVKQAVDWPGAGDAPDPVVADEAEALRDG